MSAFIDAIAARAKVEPDTVAAVLADRGVREWLPGAPAARLRIRQIRFSGFKDPHADPPGEPFEFCWDVPDGVSALATAVNFAGKTSAIEMVRWLLSGRSEVDKWVFERVREATLQFTLDRQAFTVEVRRDGGALTGRLLLGDDELRTFDNDTFEPVMDELLRSRLGLDRIEVFQRDPGSVRGKVTQAGWPLLIDALYVRPSELSTVVGGVSQRAGQLLQVYLALPWYETLLQARAAAGAATQAAGDVESAARAQADVRSGETERISKELADARQALHALDDERDVAGELRRAVQRADELAELELKAVARVQAATSEVSAALDVDTAARRLLRNIIERESAGAFFRALEPRACPRCSTVIGPDRRAHEQDGVCSVCDREATYEPDPTARQRAEAEVQSTAEAVESAEAALTEVQGERDSLANERLSVGSRIAELRASQALARRQLQEAAVNRLEGRLQEREETERRLQRTTEGPDEATRVLKVAVTEAEKLVADTKPLFKELNDEIVALGQRFGMSALTEVKLDRGAHLPVVKQGTKYNFGDLPAGDKLRLKVAVVIALLRVGARRGAGRHPGLLFVDSPGAEEVATGSLEQMISGLKEVAEELDLQIVIGTARLDDVKDVLAPNQLRMPPPGASTLW